MLLSRILILTRLESIQFLSGYLIFLLCMSARFAFVSLCSLPFGAQFDLNFVLFFFIPNEKEREREKGKVAIVQNYVVVSFSFFFLSLCVKKQMVY